MNKKAIASVAALGLVMGAVGVNSLKGHEGKRNRAYLDPVGIPTICYGHTGPDVRMGMSLTDKQCDELLIKDLTAHDRAMHRCVKVKMTRGQHDAVLDTFFNVGPGKLCKSTLVRKLNAGDYAGASRELPKWKYAGGRVLPGLVKRRADAQKLFNSGGPIVEH